MQQDVHQAIDKARKIRSEDQQVALLKEALKKLLSRPDRDRQIQNIFPELRQALDRRKAFYASCFGLVTEAIIMVQKKDLKPVYRATAIFLLENLMMQLRPDLKSAKRAQPTRKIFEKIREAELPVDSKVRRVRSERGLHTTKNLSSIAEQILKSSLIKVTRCINFFQAL